VKNEERSYRPKFAIVVGYGTCGKGRYEIMMVHGKWCTSVSEGQLSHFHCIEIEAQNWESYVPPQTKDDIIRTT